jgi:hypothetical protein
MDVAAATRGYEAWLADRVRIPLYRPDLEYKHRQLAHPSDPFPFFRGTYYRWVQRWAEAAGDLAAAPVVLAVGDLHVENYGTWRDADGRLCWGVNDFDEADRLPYTQDLVRLAASIRFARKAWAFAIKFGVACREILAGYRTALEVGGTPFVLEERHPSLRALGMAAEREPAHFWRGMTEVLADPPAEPPPDARAALLADFPADGLAVEVRIRPRAGVGSLGKPRYVALVEWAGGWLCREAKAASPPATAWASGQTGPGELLAAEAVRKAVRSPDPFYRPGAAWVVRRLAPRCSRIDLSVLTRARDLSWVLRAMGAEVANVHLGTPGAAVAILDDLAHRSGEWLADAARALAELIERDWVAWRVFAR